MMSLVLKASLCVLVFAVAGCGKKNESSAPSVSPVATEADPVAGSPRATVPRLAAGPPVANAAPPAAPIPGNATAEAAAQQMTMELRRYVAYTRTIPKSFEDFIAHHPMKYPTAPVGKKYVIADGQVVVR